MLLWMEREKRRRDPQFASTAPRGKASYVRPSHKNDNFSITRAAAESESVRWEFLRTLSKCNSWNYRKG